MIITENLTINGKAFVRTYSDSGYMVERDGVLYSDAFDPADSGRMYTESDVLCEDDVSAEDALTELVEVLS